MSRIAVPILLSFFLITLVILPASATTVTIGDIFSETDVTVSIMINDVIDVATVGVKVIYNPSVIVVTDIKKGDDDLQTFIKNLEHANDGWVKIGAYQTTEEGLSGTRKLAELTIAPVGSYGEISKLDIDVETLQDSGYNPIDAEVIDGLFYIGKNGDVNADHEVTSYDCVYIARWVAGIEGYDLREEVAEVSGDGMVDAYDCVYLARHIAGISGYEELR